MTTILPYERYLASKVLEKYASEQDRRKKDLELWKQWDASGRKPEKLKPLLNSFRGLINSESSKFKGSVPLPPASIDAEFKKQFVNSIHSYNPNLGVPLHSHVYRSGFSKAKRFIATYQNPIRVPENRIFGKLAEFKRERARLADILDREPTSLELSDHLKWPLAEVERMEQELVSVVPSSVFETDPTSMESGREAEVMKLIRYELTPEEQLVYDYTFGEGGKPRIDRAGEIARRLNMTPSKVSRIRKRITDKIQRYLR